MSKLLNYLKNKINSDKHFLEILSGSSISFLFQIIGIGLSYLFILLVSRIYGAEGLGIYTLSFTLVSIFALIGKFGLDTAIIKFVADSFEEQLKNIYITILKFLIPFNIILMIIMFYSSSYIASDIFENIKLMIPFQIVSFALIPIVLRFLHANGLRGLKQIKEYAFLQSIIVYLLAIVFLLLFHFFLNINYIPIISFTMAVIISFIISTFIWLKKINFFKPYKSKLNIKIKDLLVVSFPMLLSSSLMLVIGWTDTIMLGMYTNEANVGIYGVSLKIATATAIILTAVTSVSATKFVYALKKDNYNELKKVALFSNQLIFYTTFPIITILAVFRDEVLNLFGAEFMSGSFALGVLLLGRTFDSISGTSGYILNMSSEQKSVKNIMFFSAIVNIVLNYWLIPLYGINGAAVASATSIFLWNILFIIKIKQKFGFLNLPFKWNLK